MRELKSINQLVSHLLWGNSSFLVLSVFVILSCQPKLVEKETAILPPVPSPTLVFGFDADSVEVFHGKIKWNQTLSVLLEEFEVEGVAINQLAEAAKSVFDVRKLKAGKEYIIVHEKDSSRTLKQFIYEPDRTTMVVYNFQDSIYAKLIQKPVITSEKSISAVVNSSVYEAIIEADAPIELVNKLVDILAWQVDFFRIQKGDKFKVIYQEQTAEGEFVGVGDILGVYFEHFEKGYFGIHYQNESGKEDYFDENGESLRKTFLRSPLKLYRITSRFSGKRFHPVLKRYKSHLGTDYAASPGTPIRTVGDGVILEARYGKYNGNYVKVRHNSNYTTQYLHMQKIKSGIRPGVKVRQGETIGFVGSTGLANGPHVCYRFWKNGRQVDAQNVDLPPSEPIDAKYLDDYLHVKNVMLHRLEIRDFPQLSLDSSVEIASISE